MQQIPFVDVRDGGPIAHAKARAAAAAALRDACLAPVPRWSHVCLAPIDRLASAWLRKSASHYLGDLESIAEILGFHGAVTLNMSYLFACTTSADSRGSDAPILRRSLDWPFRGLGKCVEIAWQSGPAGHFYNVTWPGAVGVLTAMAPGRFAAVINQAPMLRRGRGPLTFPYDFALNLHNALAQENGWPPDHLLRLAFETCASFEEAIALLAREPLARPVLFTLTGTAPGEIALIERTEREARVLRGPVVVANDWQEPREGWRARMGYENNEARKSVLRLTPARAPSFQWVVPPVLNHTTRLVVEMSAAGAGELVARGYECAPWRNLPEPATKDFRLADGGMAIAA
ncbi:MAG: hypothetical protein C3F11_09560 [Methylocystaceae bacterium]|nr:MAG: hypothetical protein C3F11_09560 [Methylocystaceae bacterium]